MTFVLVDCAPTGVPHGEPPEAATAASAAARRPNPGCQLFEAPVQIIRLDAAGGLADALSQLEAGLAAGLWAAGYFSYELGYALEPRLAGLMPEARGLPLLWFGLFKEPQVLSAPEIEAFLARKAGTHRVSGLAPTVSREAYLRKFAAAQQKIAAGDIYQMNLTFKSRFTLGGCPISLYRAMRAVQPTAYGGMIQAPDHAVLSVSPELFVERWGTEIATKPMKGTAARGRNAAMDARAKRDLASDPKQRAENLMIVDLMRNDLGRISEIGSVRVDDLFAVETYPTLHQMTTNVRARLRAGLTLGDLLAALFPPGSITGAPKIRAMELIRELEDEPRGVYTGAIGMIAPDGDLRFNVAIRTAVTFPNGRGEIGIGSGVVADSIGADEYAECLLKAKFFTDAVPKSELPDAPEAGVQLIETMLFEAPVAPTKPRHKGEAGPGGPVLPQGLPGVEIEPVDGVYLLDEHMARLQKSAAALGFALEVDAVRRKLNAVLAAQTKGAKGEALRLRLRLLLDRDGSFDITAAPQPTAAADNVIRYVLSPTILASGDIYLKHKTTRRELYDREFAAYAARGADEVIYVNERGELCEGSRTTIFLQQDGILKTPPLSSGLLPGTLRAHLLRTGAAEEVLLRLEDLAAAEAIYLGNSLRGLQRALLLVR